MPSKNESPPNTNKSTGNGEEMGVFLFDSLAVFMNDAGDPESPFYFGSPQSTASSASSSPQSDDLNIFATPGPDPGEEPSLADMLYGFANRHGWKDGEETEEGRKQGAEWLTQHHHALAALYKAHAKTENTTNAADEDNSATLWHIEWLDYKHPALSEAAMTGYRPDEPLSMPIYSLTQGAHVPLSEIEQLFEKPKEEIDVPLWQLLFEKHFAIRNFINFAIEKNDTLSAAEIFQGIKKLNQNDLKELKSTGNETPGEIEEQNQKMGNLLRLPLQPSRGPSR